MSRNALRGGVGLVLVSAAACAATCSAQDFADLDGSVLAKIVAPGGAAKSKEALTFRELLGLPAFFKDTRSALVVVKTDRGNLARMLLTAERRKRDGDAGDPWSVLMIERFEVFDGADRSSRIARGRQMMIFPGFRLDLDSGQIVPDGAGADLMLEIERGEAVLRTLGSARLFLLDSPPAHDAVAASRPTPGRRVVPGDFAGRWRLFANGQLSGSLELTVEPNGAILGRFRSDTRGSAYPVTGQIAAETPRRLRFKIEFPRSTQEFDGSLFVDGKGAIAGRVFVLEQEYGFFAVREGGRIAALEGADLSDDPLPEAGEKPVRIALDEKSVALDGKPIEESRLAEALASTPSKRVVVEVDPTTPFVRIQAILEQLKRAGVVETRVVAGVRDQK
ncbi:MAG: biopolymer transporter ExbD [Isosphaeraceae bacterium]|nr:biopolymer transporter ExbD [Isosphaeraceae bacterium]